jgi:hypothetical protein
MSVLQTIVQAARVSCLSPPLQLPAQPTLQSHQGVLWLHQGWHCW